MAAYQARSDGEPVEAVPYQPLDVYKKEIRTINLLLGWPGSSLRCQLNVVPLASDPIPGYEALSYTWGAASKRYSIALEVEGRLYCVSVTDDLYDAPQDCARVFTALGLSGWMRYASIRQTMLKEQRKSP